MCFSGGERGRRGEEGGREEISVFLGDDTWNAIEGLDVFNIGGGSDEL